MISSAQTTITKRPKNSAIAVTREPKLKSRSTPC